MLPTYALAALLYTGSPVELVAWRCPDGYVRGFDLKCHWRGPHRPHHFGHGNKPPPHHRPPTMPAPEPAKPRG